MDVATANILNQVTQSFYAAQASSFSATRQSGWAGWERVLAALPKGALGHVPCRVLDVACGNMRFKSFLDENACKVNLEENTPTTWDYWAVDSCLPLVGDATSAASAVPAVPAVSANAIEGCAEVGAGRGEAEALRTAARAGGAEVEASYAAVGAGGAEEVSFVPCDVVSALLSGGALPFGNSGTTPASGMSDFGASGLIGVSDSGLAPSLVPAIPPADMTVCFGFFHHVPGQKARIRLLRALCSATRPGGVVALSLWRFMDNPVLAKKARVSHELALKHFSEQGIYLALDKGDYLLGWQHAAGTFRYCHHFSDEDVDGLVASVAGKACLIDRFRADGRTGDLNEYLVFCVL